MKVIWGDDKNTTNPSVDGALKETDFITKSIKLFNLREDLWSAVTEKTEAIEAETKERAEKRARTPGRIALAIGAFLGAAAIVAIAAPVDIFILGIAGIAALVTGGAAYGITRHIAEEPVVSLGNEQIASLEAKNKRLQSVIDQEIQVMDNSLFSQTPEVRDQFRNAFRHAALKQEVRENRVHRAKMEEKAEETAEAAQTAATMSTVAAMNASMAAMNSMNH